jgi:hypothetical protein
MENGDVRKIEQSYLVLDDLDIQFHHFIYFIVDFDEVNTHFYDIKFTRGNYIDVDGKHRYNVLFLSRYIRQVKSQ